MSIPGYHIPGTFIPWSSLASSGPPPAPARPATASARPPAFVPPGRSAGRQTAAHEREESHRKQHEHLLLLRR
jgi:hypothetical protein